MKAILTQYGGFVASVGAVVEPVAHQVSRRARAVLAPATSQPGYATPPRGATLLY